MMIAPNHEQKIEDFIAELAGFAQIAESTLSRIENDMDGNKGLFSIFEERMIAIRGTALQLSLPHIARIAGIGEEIAAKGAVAPARSQIRKCVGSLWDALTTVKYLLEHYSEQTGEEQEILMHRLEATLKAMGGARSAVSADEIEALLRSRN